jgi:Tol biopolymer transport system component
MNRGINTLCLSVLVTFLYSVCFGEDVNKIGKSPLDELPPYIKQITYFGERADWSHDGKRILFLSKMFGDAMEIEVATGKIRMLTSHFYHAGFVRAMYLANGDILLSGARTFDPEHAISSRLEKNAELWVLKKDLSKPPVPLGEHCSEGPAVSRTRMTIAWTLRNIGKIYMGDIIYEDDVPKLVNKKLILDANGPPLRKGIETQNFRPPDEKELIFSGYSVNGGDVFGLDIATGKFVNYSNSPKIYDEPEGIFPDGKYTLVECDRHNPKGNQYIDIYKFALGGSGQMERLTNFADYPGYKAANPVVSDDGKYIAFQYAKKGDQPGVGRGILIFDIAGYEAAKRKQSLPDSNQ